MATPVSNAVPVPADSRIKVLVQGSAWAGGTVTYALDMNFEGATAPWNAAWSTALRSAFQAWGAVANIQLVELAGGRPQNQSTADISVALAPGEGQGVLAALGIFPDPAFASLLLQALGYTRTTFPRPEGDIIYDNLFGGFSSVAPGSLGYAMVMHEIGHALGLKHPEDDGANGRPTGSLDARYTLMGSNIAFGGAIALTPLLYDILAIQEIYGANMSHRTGNDVYRIDPDGYAAIWDAGGRDTLEAAASDGRSYTLDLRQGEFSGGTAIAFGVTIEDARGGGGHDEIIGNPGGNALLGRNGGDVIDGGKGADTIVGGSGNDTLAGGKGGDTLDGGGGDDTVNGGDGADRLLGGGGKDVLDGGGGVDTLVGGPGADVLTVDRGDVVVEVEDGGTDTVRSRGSSFTLSDNLENLVLLSGALKGIGSDDPNRITGNELANTLRGEGGNDTLEGGTGNDTLIGGNGDDRYVGVDAGDDVREADGGGIDVVQATFSYTLPETIEHLELAGSATNGAGNPGDNRVRGNDLGNELLGLEGNDSLVGEDGNDTLDGGNGVDTLVGGNGHDLFIVLDGDIAREGTTHDGQDTVQAWTSYALDERIEDLVLMGNEDTNGTGNTSVNRIDGNVGDNTLDGSGALDILAGGDGNDLYLLNDAYTAFTYDFDIRVEKFGTVRVFSEFTGTMGTLLTTDSPGDSDSLVDRIQIPYTDAIHALRFEFTSTQLGLPQGTPLAAGTYLDARWSGTPNPGHPGLDIVDNSQTGGGQTVGEFTIAALEIDYSNPFDPRLVTLSVSFARHEGGDFEGTIDIRANQETDLVIELADGGTDTVRTPFKYALPDYVERLELIGSSNVDGYGNDGDNEIIGNDGANELRGLDGEDTLRGGNGDDTLVWDLADAILDGGNGEDTLLLESSSLDLGTADSLSNIERIDLDEAIGARTLSFTAQDVLDLSTTSQQLIVMGDDGDAVTSTGQGWTADGQQTIDSVVYDRWISGAATLLVADAITQTLS